MKKIKITPDTKISSIINHDKRAIEAISSINSHFQKLKNPILRKLLAPRVTVEEAAKIGKCRVEDIYQVLSEIGFEVKKTKKKSSDSMEHDKIEGHVVMKAINKGKMKRLDVRPILESGTDPFNNIMEEIQSLPDDTVLEIINTFKPVPLIRILKQKGYAHHVIEDKGLIKTFFFKTEQKAESTKKEEKTGNPVYVDCKELEKTNEKFGRKTKIIDVRDFEMPEPMITILNELEQLPKDHALYVYHKRVPVYLFPELDERNFTTWLADNGDGDIRMLIHK